MAGVTPSETGRLAATRRLDLPTTGASSGLFALAAMAEAGDHRATGRSGAGKPVGTDGRRRGGTGEPAGTAARPRPASIRIAEGEIPISLAAYERAFEAKVRWEAGRFADSETLDFPPRYRVDADGTLNTGYSLVDLPRTGTVYTEVTVHVPVPGLSTPYSLVVVELDDVGVRALVRVTGAEAGTVDIGDRGRLVLRRVAVRSGVPDYGYAFEPDDVGTDAEEAA